MLAGSVLGDSVMPKAPATKSSSRKVAAEPTFVRYEQMSGLRVVTFYELLR